MLSTEDEKFLEDFDSLLLKYRKERGDKKTGKILIIWGPNGRLIDRKGLSEKTTRKTAAEFDTPDEADEFITGQNEKGNFRFVTDKERKHCIKVQEIG